ncbi:MAG: alpha/beta hydrolase, partial [Cyanobacteria bacterium J06607_6]
MFLGIKENSMPLAKTSMNYVAFGQGQQPFIIFPGLSDGLKTVKNQAILLSFYYRQFAKDFRVYVFSRKNELERECSTQTMARDQNAVLE